MSWRKRSEEEAAMAALRRESPSLHWKKILARILQVKGGRAVRKDKRVGIKTMQKRGFVLYYSFSLLRQLGYRIENPFRISSKHMLILARYWMKNKLAPVTISNYFSILGIFGDWLGKHTLVDAARAMLEDSQMWRRTYAADHDKSWSAYEIVTEQIIEKIGEFEPAAGIWVTLCDEFGLRLVEAMRLDPFRIEAVELVVYRDTKGGRQRRIPIWTESQRAVLACAQAFARNNNGSLIRKDLTPDQARWRFQYALRKLGITKKILGTTLHGLRAQFACDLLQSQGIVAPVRGGEKIDKNVYLDAIIRIMELLGHSRVEIGAAYYGG
ncbi:MAG: hypothetical protein D4R84_09740 [Rhodocyclaceae bacterium]|nr:MAG: hypothetical protein D4R84_09740 [Rhodocyclaceae bacterium]